MNILSGNSVVDVLPVLFYLVLNSLCLNFHIYKREVVIDNLCKALSAWHTVSAVDVLAATFLHSSQQSSLVRCIIPT